METNSASAITSSYAGEGEGRLKVPYSFFGSVFGAEEEAAVREAMRQDTLTGGPQVAAFEREFADACGVGQAYAVTSCTTAMHVATQLFELGPGDEVIVTPITFVATTLVLLKEGVTPVFADIDPRTFNLDPAAVARKITPRTRAIYVVHYGGQMCNMDPILELARKYGLMVLEDCAHAAGAEYRGRKAGSLGDAGCFSFHSLKNITTGGEGGMITTRRTDWEGEVQMLRSMNITAWDETQHEWRFGPHRLEKEPGDYWIPSHFDVAQVRGRWGNNYRMNEIQAAIGRAQLRKLDALNETRRRIGRALTDGIRGIPGITPVYEDPDCRHVYHLYTVCVEEDDLGASRDDLLRVLVREEGIQGILHYQPTYHFSGLRALGLDTPANCCPEAERFFYRREFNLPMHPRLTDDDVNLIVRGIHNAAQKVRR